MVKTALPFPSSESSTNRHNGSTTDARGLEMMEEGGAPTISGNDFPSSTSFDNANKSRSENIYIVMGNSKKVLVTLCIGLLRDDQTPLIDIERSPWSQELKATMKPMNKDLAVEVSRRQQLFAGLEGTDSKLFMMKPNNKSREVLLDWLNAWPICDTQCVAFLVAEAQRVESLLQAAIDESRENTIALKHGAWIGALPYLRLIHAITDSNETRMAYLRRYDPKSREELDAGNSPSRQKTAYESIAEKWNDPDFNPVTRVSTCHVDFASPIELPHSKVRSLIPADAISVQNRLSGIRVSLLRMIERWEQSGQGDGGRSESNYGEQSFGWGQLEGRSQEALDRRENFLGGNPSWYLYFWEITDMYQLLDSTLQRLSEGVGATGASDVSAVSRTRVPNSINIDAASSPTGGESVATSTDKNITGILEKILATSELDRQAAYAIQEKQAISARDIQEKQEVAARELQARKRFGELRDLIDEYEEKYELTEKQFYVKVLARKRAELEEIQEELMAIEKLKHGLKHARKH